MHDTAAQKSSPSIGLWVLLLGGSGFAAGFFGPIAINPDANQGPMVGIFITGPGGALAGLIIGAVFRLLPAAASTRWYALYSACGALVIGTLIFCLPAPILRGHIIEARATQCFAPQQLFAAGVTRWQRAIAAAPWAKPPAAWQTIAARALQEDRGVVLEMTIARQSDIYEQRRPWNRGKIIVTPLQPIQQSKNYFARDAEDNCDEYLQRPTALYFPQAEHEGDDGWPPATLPNFLDLLVLGPVPTNYRPASR